MSRIPAHLLSVVLLLAAACAFAAGPPSQLVWEDRFDVGGHDDGLRHVVVRDGHVVADGLSLLETRDHAGRRERATHVSIYELESGELVWRQQLRAKGANNLLVADRTVILTRYNHFRVAAYDLESGEALWTSEEGTLEAALQQSAVGDGILYTGGYWRPGEAPEFALLVQARDPRSGTLAWEERRPVDPPGHLVHVSDLAVHKGRLAVISGSIVGLRAQAITVYDAATGKRLWTRPIDAGRVALCRNRLFVSGVGPEFDTFFVRALALRTGDAVWERTFTQPEKDEDYRSEGLLCAGPWVYAAAFSDDPHDQEDPRLFLWALDRKRGAVRWRDEFQGEAPLGRIQQIEGSSLLFRVQDRLRVYSRRGRLRWELDPLHDGGWSRVDLTRDGRLAVVGSIFLDQGRTDAVVRVLR